MEKNIDKLESLLGELTTELEPWIGEVDTNMDKYGHKGFSKSFNDKGQVAKAQISASFAFILQTLYFSLLKLNNTDTEEHEINKEIARVRKLYIKIDKVLNPEKYEQKPDTSKAQVTKRIVSSVLSANNFIKKQQHKDQQNAKRKVEDISKKQNKKKHKVDSAALMEVDSD